jgi:hypothetical protein
MRHVATSMEFPDGLPTISPNKDAKRSKLGLAVVVRLSNDSSVEQ